jgi:hypothetical protein
MQHVVDGIDRVSLVFDVLNQLVRVAVPTTMPANTQWLFDRAMHSILGMLKIEALSCLAV